MNAIALFTLRIAAPAIGVLVSLLGLNTLEVNLMGWFLFVAGVVYAAGAVIVAFVLKRNFWESQITGLVTHTEPADHSFWLISIGLTGVFFISPLEFMYLDGQRLHLEWLEIAGACVAVPGLMLFVWARSTLQASYAWHLATKESQPLVRSGAYRLIRHPAYAGILLVCAGLAAAYGSFGGAAVLLLLLLPAFVWRIGMEERLLSVCFGAAYQRYAKVTSRLIPGVW